MIELKKGCIVQDYHGEKYCVNFNARVKPKYYLNSRLIFLLGNKTYAVSYNDIEFVSGDGKVSDVVVCEGSD
jgi:hypothetical protein